MIFEFLTQYWYPSDCQEAAESEAKAAIECKHEFEEKALFMSIYVACKKCGFEPNKKD